MNYPVPVLDTGSQRHRPYPIISFDTASSLAAPCQARGQDSSILTNSEPIAIGGGTYARAFENCVSFGANFPEDTDMCHQANEFINIDKLILSCKIYAETIYELISKEFDNFM